ncbi:AraC family transcriptional regulator [Proteiniphilum sp.]|uniref:AraC family transcriptional regulator n=1 Tax=Proteiniphilum sp. TaxID=1926877 RepID=UPI002B20CF91|nr:AraC family transcriptional regulator [Proteiniphilum sp.]MEA4917978.1 AraC family transcriptional regulator [Proteiniphilum sp.]
MVGLKLGDTKIKQYHLHKDEPDKVQFEIYSLKEYLEESVGHLYPHRHSFYQIIWFISGKGKHYVDFNEYEVKENSLFFVSKGQIHYFDNNSYEGCIIHFNESFVAEDENYINIFLNHNIFHSFEKEPFFTINEQDTKEFHNIVNQLQAEMWVTSQFAHAEYLKHLLHLFLILIQRFGVKRDCDGLSMNNPSHTYFVRFRKLLEENYHAIHTVNDYAGLLNISSKTLTNCTKEISSQTPLEIINDRILLEARRLLAYSDKNVNEIGFDLGFEDPSYFAKFFKRQMKMLPRDFRKLNSSISEKLIF